MENSEANELFVLAEVVHAPVVARGALWYLYK